MVSITCSSAKPIPVVKPHANTPEQIETSTPPPTDTAQGGIQPGNAGRVPEKLRIAYVPSIEGGEIIDKTADVDKALSQLLGIPVESKIIPNYVMAVEGLAAGQLDCAMLNPLGYVLGRQRYPIEVILRVMRNGSTEYRGQIIASVDSGIKTVEDLKGHTFAFVDQVSTSGHLYPRVLMLKNGIDIMKDIKNRPIFAGSHDKVAIDVMHGTVDAGATFNDVRTRVSEKFPEVMKKTMIVALTDPIPNENFCVTADLDPAFKEKLKRALMEISRGVKDGMEIKKPLLEMDDIDELIPASDTDYNSVREMIKNLDFDLMGTVEKSVKTK